MGDIANALGLAKPKVAVNPQTAMAAPAPNPLEALLAAAGPKPSPIEALSTLPLNAPAPEGDAAPVATVAGDAWKPHKKTFLGGMIDGYLMAHGGKPVFTLARDQKNMAEAMAGYADDPKAALTRLMRIPGHQADGLAAFNQLADNQRADSVLQRARDADTLKFSSRLGGMLTSIKNSKDPAGQYQRMLPNLQAYAGKYGLDPLPDKYDPEAVDLRIGGSMDMDDQARMAETDAYRAQTVALRERALDQGDTRIADNRNYRDTRLQQFATAETDKNNRAATAEEGRNKRSANAHPKPTILKTPRGLMKVSPDGLRGVIATPQGNQRWVRVGNQWKQVQE